jgi:hypothetical protein
MPAHAFWTANAVVDPSTGTALEYPQLKLGDNSKLWLEATSRKIGRIAQGKQPDMPDKIPGVSCLIFVSWDNNRGRRESHLPDPMCQLGPIPILLVILSVCVQ